MVEQRTENPCVGGSIPSITTNFKDRQRAVFFCCARAVDPRGRPRMHCLPSNVGKRMASARGRLCVYRLFINAAEGKAAMDALFHAPGCALSPYVPPFLTGFPGDRSTGPYFAGFRKWFVFSSQAFQYQDVPAPGHRIVLVVHQTVQTYGGFHTSFCACHWEENSCNTRYLRLQIQMVCAC